ncbi:MAG: LPS export ABC transporter permease LptF [Sideroxydans sp.]|nr:LPS export ABC transporter permease LptF [Sideroxydans sp.]
MLDYPQSPDQKSKKACTHYVRGIFYWTLMREFVTTGMLVFSILFGIVVFTQLIRFLGESVSGYLAVDAVAVMLGFSAVTSLPIILSISLFLSVLMTLTRCYRDSEMVVWFSAGIGLTRWIRPVMGYAIVVSVVIATFSLGITPWALSQADEFKRRLSSRDDVSSATPGVFRESKQDDRVFFMENVDAEKRRVGNIFVQSVQNGVTGTMVAKEGFQEMRENGERYLIMLNGTRYEGVPGQADFKIAEFERYSMRIEPQELRESAPSLKALSSLYLMQNPSSFNRAELAWRIGLPVSAIVLALMAIPLSFVDPRAGRSLNFISAVVVFMLYNNLINLSHSWVSRERIGLWLGFWGLHLLMLVLLALLFYHRSSVFAWARWKR